MQSDSKETAVFSIRWVILASFCMTTVLVNFVSKSFTVADEIYAAYYGVSLSEVDLSALAVFFGAGFCTPIFSWLFFKRTIGLRVFLITGSVCLLVSYIFVLLSIQFVQLYPLMVVVNTLQGVAYLIHSTVGPSFAVVWFPNNEVSLAIAIDLFSHNAGLVLGSILPPVFLKNPPTNLVTNITADDFDALQEKWKTETHKTLLFFYIPCAVVLFILILIFIAIGTDQPLKPPTHAMLAKRKTTDKTPTNSLSQFFDAVKSLHTDVNLVLCTFALNIIFYFSVPIYLNITVIVESFNIQDLEINLSNDVMGGILIVTYSVSNIGFGFLSAKLSSIWKNFVRQAITGSFFAFLAFIGLTLSFYYRMFYSFWVCLVLYSFGARIFLIPMLEVITRHTYPVDEVFVNIWVTAYGTITGLILGEIGQSILLYIAPIGLFIFMCVCVFIAVVLALIMNPTDKRKKIDLEYEMEESCEDEESMPLVAKK